MLIGPAWSEGRLAAIADGVHRAATDRVGATRMSLPPAAQPDALAAEETALFCIGAHMSGLPLNHQLTALGGRFLCLTQTAATYRLLRTGRPTWHAACGRRRRDRRAKSGRCRPPRSAHCSRRCRRRLASARSSWAKDPPGLPGRGGGCRRCARHHMPRRLARLACGEGRGMSDHDDLDAWLDANAALLGITCRSGMARCGAAASAHHARPRAARHGVRVAG